MTSVAEGSPRKSAWTRAMVARSTRTTSRFARLGGSGRGSSGSADSSSRRSGRTGTGTSLCWFDNRTRTRSLLPGVGDAGVHHVFERARHRLGGGANLVHGQVALVELVRADLVLD